MLQSCVEPCAHRVFTEEIGLDPDGTQHNEGRGKLRGEPTTGDWETQNLQGGGDWPTAGSGRVETEDLWEFL